MASGNQEGKFKQGSINIVIISILGCFVLSYVIYASIFKFTHGNKLTLFESLKEPSAILSYIKSDEDLKIIAIFLPIVLIGIALYMLRNNLFNDKYSDASKFGLHGTSDWGDPDKLRNGKTFSKNSLSKYSNNLIKNLNNIENGYILGRVPNSKKLLIMHDETDVDNQNVAVFGSTGAFKTQSYVLPNVINIKNKSIIVTDPKGEIHEMTNQLKRDQGYKVYQVDFVHFMQSKYNPLTYVETPLQAQKVANTIISNFEGQGGGDNVFFKNQATNMLAALIIYVKAEYPPEKANMKQVINVYTNHVQDEETFHEWMKTVPKDHPAREMLNAILDLTGNTRGSVTSTLNNGFSIFRLPQVQAMTGSSDFHYKDFIDEKSILYVKLSMEDDTFSPLTSVFFSQMIDIYYDIAKQRPDNKLKRKMVFLLDEFANIGKIDKYSKVLATCRSLGLSMHTIIQNKSQLEKDSMYGSDEANDILGNHDTKLILRAQRDDTQTTKWISETLGNTTKKHTKTSITYSKNDTSKQVSPEYIQRELMTPDEIGSLDKEEAILSITGHEPMLVHKAFQFEVYPEMLSKEVNGEFIANYNNIRETLGYTEPVAEHTEYDIEQEVTFSEYRKQMKEKRQKEKEVSIENKKQTLIDEVFHTSNITQEERENLLNEEQEQQEVSSIENNKKQKKASVNELVEEVSNITAHGESVAGQNFNMDL